MTAPIELSSSTVDVIEAAIVTAKWVLGIAGTIIVFVIGALFRLVYKFGQTTTKLESVAANMLSIEAHADRVPLIDQRVTTLEKNWETFADRYRQANGSIPDEGDCT